jgi:3-phosphoshikimate 1-carboxyvinyltransferase
MQPGEPAETTWRTPAADAAVHASVSVPGSKSITNRALILAALSDQPTVISGPLRARDTMLMADAISALGGTVLAAGGRDGTTGQDWLVTPGWRAGTATVDVGNAGTVLRFVPPVAALATADVEFHGDPRAAERPVWPLLAGLRQLGVQIDDGGRGAVPFIVRGRGGVPGGAVTVDASSSSQLVSGLLLPAARYDKGAEIRHEGPPVPSAPHLAMTVTMLRAAGADVETSPAEPGGAEGRVAPDIWRVHPGRLRPERITVEPDLSSTAPFLAAAVVTGGQVTITGWPARSLQAADQILAVFSQLGATCTAAADGMTVAGTGTISGITVDLRDISELTPVLTAVAALALGPSRFTGIGHLRLHETDRLAALVAEIGKLGGQVSELPDGLQVQPRPLRAAAEPFDSHNDHRMVMAAAVLGLAVPGLQVRNAATVGKTFPEFIGLWQQMLGLSP